MEYRLYFLDPADHIRGVEPFEAESDAIAIDIMERLTKFRPAELWNRDRLVVRRTSEFVAQQ